MFPQVLLELVLAIESLATSYDATRETRRHMNPSMALHVSFADERFAATEGARVWSRIRQGRVGRSRNGSGVRKRDGWLQSAAVGASIAGIHVFAGLWLAILVGLGSKALDREIQEVAAQNIAIGAIWTQ